MNKDCGSDTTDENTVGVDLNWLEETLKKRNDLYDISKILSVEVKPAVADGENYVSKIYRLKLKALTCSGKEKLYSLIMKRRVDISFENQDLNKKLEAAFNLEYEVYANVLSKLSKYWSKTDSLLWAKCLGTIPNKDIYFEDLKESGHAIANRLNGLDFEHALIFFRQLAEFHAASYIAISKGEVDLEPYRVYLMAKGAVEGFKIKSNPGAMMVDVIRNEWTPEWRNLADRLERICEILPDSVRKLMEIDETRINVLNHGDTWVNNFMFKYDPSGKPVSLKFVDFQLSHYNSFCVDICHFLSTSVKHESKKKYLNTWIEAYCEKFSKCLDELQCNKARPQPEIIKKELFRLVPYAILITLRIRPIIMSLPKDAMTYLEIMSDTGLNSKKRRLYTNPNFAKEMEKELPELLTLMESLVSLQK